MQISQGSGSRRIPSKMPLPWSIGVYMHCLCRCPCNPATRASQHAEAEGGTSEFSVDSPQKSPTKFGEGRTQACNPPVRHQPSALTVEGGFGGHVADMRGAPLPGKVGLVKNVICCLNLGMLSSLQVSAATAASAGAR